MEDSTTKLLLKLVFWNKNYYEILWWNEQLLWSENKTWVKGFSTYINEYIFRVEAHHIDGGTMFPHKTPLRTEVHPELYTSPLLDDKGVKIYQMLIGMIQWACVVGRLDISFAVSSMSRFSANPLEMPLKLLLHIMGYLKKHPNRRIVVDSIDL